MRSVSNGNRIDAIQAVEPVISDVPSDLNSLRALIHDEMSSAVADIERRLGQARELEKSSMYGSSRSIHAEDLNLSQHIIDGYTLTANSPGAGSIAWTAVHIVYLGVDYTIADGNTALKYTWFIKPGSGTTATMSSSNTMPTLGNNDAIIFVNNAGTPVSALGSSIAYAVGAGVVGNTQIADGAVTSAKTNFYTALAQSITDVGTAAALAQATADGSITTYFQSTIPWANGDATAGGAASPVTKVGDVWYDSTDGQAYRWSGAAGTPANTWIAISDSDIGAALAAANAASGLASSKITTFYGVLASPPTALAVGDLWVVSDQNNQVRRATAIGAGSWATLLIGDAAISGIGGTKVGTGINGSNVTTGTVVAARVGTGVTGADLTSGTGTVGSSQIGSNAVTPAKINAAFHLLY